MSSILRYPKQIGPSDQYIAIPNLQTLAAKACEFISTNPAYVGNSKGFIIPATPQLFGAIENFNSDPALVPVLRDMGKQVFAPMATSLSSGFAGQVTGSGYFEEVQLLLPKPIVYPQGFIGGPNGNAFGVVGSSPDSYTPYLTFYLPKTLGGVLGIPVAYYTVTYDLNGGSGVVPQTTAYIAGTLVTVAGGITRPGFVFNGWNTRANGLGINQTEGSHYIIQDNIVLYALWISDGFGSMPPSLTVTLSDQPNAINFTYSASKNYGEALYTASDIIPTYPLPINNVSLPMNYGSLSAYVFLQNTTNIFYYKNGLVDGNTYTLVLGDITMQPQFPNSKVYVWIITSVLSQRFIYHSNNGSPSITLI